MSFPRSVHLVSLAAAALLAAAPAMAANSFNLRVLNVEANWATNPDDATQRFFDYFNDGNLQSGASLQNYALASGAMYGLSGAAPVETVPGDLSIDGNVLGKLNFSLATATPPSPLTVNGAQFTDRNNRITLRGNQLTNALPNFTSTSAWEFATPDQNTRYGMRFSDGTPGATNDIISLDVMRMGDGTAGVQLRRVFNDGVSVTISGSQTFAVASGLFGGYTVDDVDLVALHMYWNPSNGVFADVDFVQVANGGATRTQVGHLSFSNQYAIFNGENFTRVQAGASWTAPAAAVPEPGSLALLGAGLAAMGALVRRRRGA